MHIYFSSADVLLVARANQVKRTHDQNTKKNCACQFQSGIIKRRRRKRTEKMDRITKQRIAAAWCAVKQGMDLAHKPKVWIIVIDRDC
jgi:hypothetical protein